MKTSHRLPILLAILALCAGLVLFGPKTSQGNQAIVDARPTKTPTVHENGRFGDTRESETQVLALRDRAPEESNPKTAFAIRDWTPPPLPTPPLSVAPPPPPEAPPLPFTFIGKQLEGGSWTVFLANQDRTYTVKSGMVIESVYRVDQIVPPTLSLTYLPMQQPQTLAIGPSE